MRFPVALGLFLVIASCMVLVLRPVYDTGERLPYQGVEAAGPVEVYRPVPTWVALGALIGGGITLLSGLRRRRR